MKRKAQIRTLFVIIKRSITYPESSPTPTHYRGVEVISVVETSLPIHAIFNQFVKPFFSIFIYKADAERT